jgi:hypothetical protein
MFAGSASCVENMNTGGRVNKVEDSRVHSVVQPTNPGVGSVHLPPSLVDAKILILRLQ